jgi:hypothetical protein
MRRKLAAAAVVVLGLLGGAAAYVGQSKVPQEAIRNSVSRTVKLVDRAWGLPVAASFGRALDWQSNGSVCGAAALANVFRSLGEKADTEGELLEGVGGCWFHICPVGLTLDDLAEIARAHTSRRVTVLRDLSPEVFREILRDVNNPERRYVVNFSRKAIFGAGVGHHSPIGGYLEDEDLVFVLDVNEDYRPWLIERSRLFTAIDTLDGKTKRGLLRIE